jgi:hypothetical protein
MESQTECEATTNEPIPNTFPQGSERPQSEQPTSKKPTDSELKTDHDAGKSSQSFTLLDLRRLTFTLDALAQVVSEVSNVEEWYLEERRDFINGLRAFCRERNYPFPFTIVDEETIPTVQLVQQTQEVSGQEVNAQNSAEEEAGDALTD